MKTDLAAVSDNEFVHEYEFKGLRGRWGHWPALSKDAKRTFVLSYGQHASIERMLPIIEAMRTYGDVYLPDNPGFGGMDAAYAIDRYPDLEFYAEHFKHFIDTHVDPDRKLTLLGVSYGFQMLTELVNRYPELHPRIEEMASFVGFVHHKDLHMAKRVEIPLMYIMCNFGRTRFGAWMFANVFLRESIITRAYSLSKFIQPKFKAMSGEEADRYAREQANLWIINESRTHGVTAWDFFKKNDLTSYRIPLRAVHIGVPNDHLLDTKRVEGELKDMFKELHTYRLNLDNHAPLDIETREQVLGILPAKLKKHFESSDNKGAVAV